MYVFVLSTILFSFRLHLLQCLETDDGHHCQCVPFYRCKNGFIITNGDGLLGPRTIREPVGNFTKISSADGDRCGEYHRCCKPPLNERQDSFQHKCGKSNYKRTVASRIRGKDVSTAFGEWPWQGAVLQERDSSQFLFKCGCVLISEKYVLTVAHCVSEFSRRKPPVIVRLGAWDLRDLDNPRPFVDRKVSRIMIHSGFHNTTLVNDIALLKLSKSVKSSSYVDRICLPYHNESHHNEFCVVTGWGKNAIVGSSYSHYLRKTFVPVINQTQCQRQLRTTRLGDEFILHRSFICAGGIEGEDACKGDGGGPLACHRKDGTYALMGLVSWGIDCGEAGIPGVYVDVKRFLGWIEKVTKHPMGYYWP